MSYPHSDEIKAFSEILDRDGIQVIFENLVEYSKENPKLSPMIGYLSLVISVLLKDDLIEESNGYVSGYVSCLDIFRRHFDTQEIKLEDIELQIGNLCGWISFLEEENLAMRNEINELTRKNKELSKLSSVQEYGNFPHPS